MSILALDCRKVVRQALNGLKNWVGGSNTMTSDIMPSPEGEQSTGKTGLQRTPTMTTLP